MCNEGESSTKTSIFDTHVNLPSPTNVNVDFSCISPELGPGASLTCSSDSGPVTVGRYIPASSNCQVSCAIGFYLHGVSTASCQAPGAWSAMFGSCRPICTSVQLPTVPNGVWRCKGLEVLSCTLECNPGFQSNRASASCTNGAWAKSNNPACLRRKGAPHQDPKPNVIQPPGVVPSPTAVLPGIFRSSNPAKGFPPGAFSCPLPDVRPIEGFSCPSERNGRVPLGQSCYLQCEGNFKTKSKCTRQGWLPDVQTLSCPTFRLYTFSVTCPREKPSVGAITCKHQGKEFVEKDVPAGGVCTLHCPPPTSPTWATQSTCLKDGYWDTYLGCV